MPIKPRPLQVPIHTQKCNIEVKKIDFGEGEEERFLVNLSLTMEEFVAFQNMIKEADNVSVFTQRHDVHTYLRNALMRAKLI
jgi:hypothetical protein